MKITQNISFLINYKPILSKRKNIKNKKMIYCKNFFLFFILLNSIFNNNKNQRCTITIKKSNTYRNTFLRAPNKYKKAQIALELVRYKVIFKKVIFYSFKGFEFKKNTLISILYFINFFFNFFLFLESPLFFLSKKKILVELDKKLYKKLIFEL